MAIKCVLIDDDPLALEILRNNFTDFTDFKIIGLFNDALEALDFINNNLVDAVFMEIKLPIISGFELLKLINNKIHIIITTSSREFAVESYDQEVLDYLLKPIPFPRFIKCINKLSSEFSSRNDVKIKNTKSDSHIFIKVDKKMVKITIDDILFIEGMKDYIKVVLSDKTYVTHKSLTSLSEELPQERFIRIHKSYTIAIDKVKFIEGNKVQIHSHSIPIGRNYTKDAKIRILE